MNKLVFLTAILLSTAAYATGNGNQSVDEGLGIQGSNVNGSVITNNSNNGAHVGGGIDIDNNNKAYGGNAVAFGGKGGEADARSNSKSYSDADAKSSSKSEINIKDRLQAPAVFAPGLANGFECNGSTTIGGSVAGFGVGGGSTHANEDCVNVYLAGVLLKLKDEDGAWGILCESDKIARHAEKCATKKLGNLAPGASMDSHGSEYPTGRMH